MALKLEDIRKMMEEIVDAKMANIKKPKQGTIKVEKEVSKRQLKILDVIASSNKEVKSEAFATIASKAGYPKAKGASAMFRGKNASLKYRIEKFIELTPRGHSLLLASKTNVNKPERVKVSANKVNADTSSESLKTPQMSGVDTPDGHSR
jgi:hypothetical protein